MSKIHKILANPFFPKFQSNGLLAGSTLETVHLGFCIIFRHDMDGLDNKEKLANFIRLDRQLGVPSTCFFENTYLKRYPEMLQSMQSDSNYEIQLHSRARPYFTFAFPPIQGMPKLIPMEGWLYARYRANLAKQLKYFSHIVKPKVNGHSPHAENNYLYFNTYMNWSIIERATADSGFDYLSDWRLPSRTSENEEFPAPLPPRAHAAPSGKRSLIVPTAWDDKFFFSSFEDRQIWGSDPGKYSGRTVEQAFNSAQRKIELCHKNKMPFVINLHPRHFFDDRIQSLRVKEKIVDWASQNGASIKTFGQVWSEWKVAQTSK